MSTRASRSRKREMEMDEKLHILDQDLLSFCQYCEQAGFTPEEMQTICTPLGSTFRRNNIKRALKIITILGILAIGLYAASHVNAVNMHMSAMGRILLIQLLPIWDWTRIFYENCLVNNPMYQGFALTEDDCLSCEAIERVERISDANFHSLVDKYLSRDGPVIIVDAMTEWPVMKTDNFYFDNITSIYLEDEKLSDTVPCVLTSNLRPGSSDLSAFLKRILSPRADKWFVHWQNCDINAVKALRKFYQRPYFLSSGVAPAHFNWVLMSSQYTGKMFRRVDVDTGLIMLAQIRGSTSFRLSPHAPCNSSCPELYGDLHEGEMLVLANYMWALDYCPGRHMDNVAILTETVWDDYHII